MQATTPSTSPTSTTPNGRNTILITGSSGLIGTRLARHLEHDHVLVGLDVCSSEDADAPVHHFDADLTDDESVRNGLAAVKRRHGEHLAAVIHLAAYYDFSGEPSPLYEQLTVEGTRRLLRELQNQRFTVEQFVFSSSLLVMRPDEHGRKLSELSATEAEWAYPQSKLDAEAVIREEHGHIPYVILRIAGVYDEHCHSLPISQQIARINERQLESHVFPGDMSHGQALVHLDDLADCIRKVVDNRSSLSGQDLFLVAEPDVMSYGELQDRIGELIHGQEWTTIRIPKAVAKVGAYVQQKLSDEGDQPFIKPWMIDLADDQYLANIAHARVKLGWNPKNRLRETLPAMIDFLLSDPRQFYEIHELPMPEVISTHDRCVG